MHASNVSSGNNNSLTFMLVCNVLSALMIVPSAASCACACATAALTIPSPEGTATGFTNALLEAIVAAGSIGVVGATNVDTLEAADADLLPTASSCTPPTPTLTLLSL